MMRVHLTPYLVVIFLQYDRQKYPDSFEHFRSYMRGIDPSRVSYILVNNNDEGVGTRKLDANTTYLQGDNSDWEFSGWQRGVEFLRQNHIKHDVALLLNDSFEVNGPGYLSNHNIDWLVLKTHIFKCVFGLLATRWTKAQIQDKPLRKWLGTDCFFVPGILLDKLGTLVSVDQASIAEYLPETFPGTDEVFLRTAPINAAYRESIVKWLTQEWHSKFVLDQSTWSFFLAKVKAILNEALLYVRIRELGYLVLPYDIPLFISAKIRGLVRKFRESLSRTTR